MLFASHFILNRLALICILNTSDCIIPLAYQKVLYVYTGNRKYVKNILAV